MTVFSKMAHKVGTLVVMVLAMAVPLQILAEPVPIVFDTDMGNDIDDALALAMLHALESRRECKLLAVTITKATPYAAVFVDLVNHFYGRPDIPVGLVGPEGKTPEATPMIRVPVERQRTDGSPLYPRKLQPRSSIPRAVRVLREVLAQQKESSVVVVQVGFSTNLAQLLASQPDDVSPLAGRELVTRKVKRLVVMAGHFVPNDAERRAEYNVRTDIPSARKVFSEWPTEIVASGFEVGLSVLYPAWSIERHYRYVAHHPIVDAYRNYKQMPYDRPTWDLTAVLYAVRPEDGYFELSERGWVNVSEDGKTDFRPDPAGRHRYLILPESHRARVLEAFMNLASQPPQGLPAR